MECNCGKFEPRTTTNYVNDIIVCKNCGRQESTLSDKETTPIYTKAMADNGELPSVGAVVEIKGVLSDFRGLAVTIIGVNKHSDGDDIFTFEHEHEGIGCITIFGIIPIDTRTSEEKAIDDLCGKDNCYLPREYAVDLFTDIKAGKINGVTFND